MLAVERRVSSRLLRGRRWLPIAAILLTSGLTGVVRAQSPPPQSGQPAAPTVNTIASPPPQYFAALALYYAGNYAPAGTAFQSLIPSAVAIERRPVETICYLTMQGECFYQSGQYKPALASYEAAIKLHLAFGSWTRAGRAFLPPVGRVTPPLPWHVSQRNAAAWNFPPTISVPLNNQFPFSGTVIRSTGPGATVLTVNFQEIARCTCLAMYRWFELLGPLCPSDPFMPQLARRRILGPSVHPWATVVEGVENGLIAAGQQKPAVARQALQSALTYNGLDHPLTGLALLALGRLAEAQGDDAKAEACFLEASAAAAQFGDLTVVEEALRAAASLHLARCGRKPYPPLHAALGWAAASGSAQMSANLELLAAEDNLQSGLAAAGAANLAACSPLVAGSGMAAARTGARLSFLGAQIACAGGDVADGQAALQLALAFQRQNSFWRFRTEMVDAFWQGRLLSERKAVEQFARLLNDPTPADWARDPLEAFSSLVIPHPGPFERWVEAALVRKEPKLALQAVEQLRRHRFLCTLEGGGRLLGLRWALEARPGLLNKDVLQQRQAILGRWPKYVELSRRASQLQAELKAQPLLPGAPEEQKVQREKLAELKHVGLAQETLLRQMALSRQGCDIAFPPVKTADEIQAGLGDRQGVLVFFEDSRRYHAFLITSTQLEHWQINVPPQQVAGRVKALLQAWGNLDANKPVGRKDLEPERWQPSARELFKIFVTESNVDFTQQLDELIIVPDGILWYLPFETLQVPDEAGFHSLISEQRVRYLPTASLAAGDVRLHRPRTMALLPGKLFPRADDGIAYDWQQELLGVLPQATLLEGKLPAEATEFASLLDELIVCQEIPLVRQGPLGWSPLPTNHRGAGASLAAWLSLPWGGPDQILLPGFHTSAESAARGLSDETAINEVFLPLCGLMASGARTALINRWRSGGQTAQDLLREFVQELPDTYASDAWQRSVQLATSNPIRLNDEPRLKRDGDYDGLLGDHPFFWAGFLLADTGSPPPGAADDKSKK